ncbi:MAG: PH domain-containing protein [Acidimicrobiales bacterium]
MAGVLLCIAGAFVLIVSLTEMMPGGVAAGVGLAVFGVMPWRMRVDATAEALVLSGGLRTRRLGWDEIETFRLLSQRWPTEASTLYAILRNGEMTEIPLPFGGGAVRSKNARANLSCVRDNLERCRLDANAA